MASDTFIESSLVLDSSTFRKFHFSLGIIVQPAAKRIILLMLIEKNIPYYFMYYKNIRCIIN